MSRNAPSEHLERAYALVTDLPPSPAKGHVLSQVARYRMLAEAREEAIRIGEEALAIAEELCLRELQAHALVNIGTARTGMGDGSGIEDLLRAIEIASATGSPAHCTRVEQSRRVVLDARGLAPRTGGQG